VAGVEYWNEISIVLNCRNAGVVFPLWLTVYGNYRSSANRTVTHLNSITSRRCLVRLRKACQLVTKKSFMVWIVLPRVSDRFGGCNFPSGKVGQNLCSLKNGCRHASLLFMSCGVIGYIDELYTLCV
jgi:hypothetical protein